MVILLVLLLLGFVAIYYFRPKDPLPSSQLKYRKLTPPLPDKSEVSVATYNTLANLYARKHKTTPPNFLVFEYRSRLLGSMLAEFETDFICLQEVDRYEEFFDPTLKALGYQSAFAKRFGIKADGCVLAWRFDSWTPVHMKRIEFNKHSMAGSNPSFMRDNVAMLGLFRHKRTLKEVVVGSAHLFWDHRFEQVKYA
jgi:CCR4-NOT transcription complex subunit 6